MNRRNFLKISGSTAVILAAGGAGYVMTRTPIAAQKPWAEAGSLYDDPMRRALSYAILAPNPHNRQPWVVELKSDTEAVLTCDLERLLPETDPFSRQIVIGLGCFLELFSIAAAEQGYRADFRYFPEGDNAEALDARPIANLSLVKDAGLAADPLFAQVMERHTNRTPYDMERAISGAVLQRLDGVAADRVTVGTSNDVAFVESIRVLTRDAIVTELRTPVAYQETIDLMRIGRAEIEANPDGISLAGPFLETLYRTGLLTRESLADPASSNFQIGIDMVVEGAMSAMGFVWINTGGNDRTAQIEAGRAFMRVALQATEDGLVMQPLSQALQEYPEMTPFFASVHEKLTSGPNERVQMLARLGYAKRDVGPAPRWALETRVKA